MMRFKGILIACILGLLPLMMDAQYSPSRHIQSVYALEVGGASLYDNYLSPLKYSGTSLALTGDWSKMLPANPQHLLMDFSTRISGDLTTGPTGMRKMYNAGVRFDWGLLYKWTPSPAWSIAAGGAVGFDAGCLYLPSNGNNPADGSVGAGLSLRLAGDYSFHIGKLPVRISDSFSLPSLSVFFTHGYAEPYYEIYIGNYKGLVAAGWWGNRFQLDNLLAADLKLGKNALRVGYRFNVGSSWHNHLNTQIINHSFVVGIIPNY